MKIRADFLAVCISSLVCLHVFPQVGGFPLGTPVSSYSTKTCTKDGLAFPEMNIVYDQVCMSACYLCVASVWVGTPFMVHPPWVPLDRLQVGGTNQKPCCSLTCLLFSKSQWHCDALAYFWCVLDRIATVEFLVVKMHLCNPSSWRESLTWMCLTPLRLD